MSNKAEHTDVVVHDGFTVRDAASANWVVRKVVEARAYAVRVKMWAELERRRAEREEAFLLHRFGAELESWARQQIAVQHDGRRSTSLPSGTIGFRTEPTRLSITDDRKALAWCREHLPSAIRTVESLGKTALMDHVKTTGECPHGVEMAGGNERFYVSAKNIDFDKGGQDAVAE